MVSEKRLRKLADAEYRQEFLRSSLTAWVVNQLRTLRRQRNWTQEDLAERADIKQSGVARAESEDYGNWNTNTLVKLANAFDVALEIRFVPWPKYMRGLADTSPEGMQVSAFSVADFEVQTTTYERGAPERLDVKPSSSTLVKSGDQLQMM